MSDRIDKAKLKAYIAEELENVAGLKKQLTDADIEKLELEFTKTEIHQTLLEMENFAQLQKKYRSVKLTLTNWIRLKRRKEQVAKENAMKRHGFNGGLMTHTEALTWLEKKGMSYSQLTDKFELVKEGNDKNYWRLKG
tara:strand:- start:166159 stop:166572 length:414 start_codon:yes stop_codon:yes gene_type:complete